MKALLREPALVAAFLALFAAAQLRAIEGQLQLGFVPFRHPPGRVPFSWDMFSIEISRCDVEWDPALPVGKGYHHFRDFGAPFEWDPVYNVPQGYVYAALIGCRFRRAPTRVQLDCMTPRGRIRNAFHCP